MMAKNEKSHKKQRKRITAPKKKNRFKITFRSGAVEYRK